MDFRHRFLIAILLTVPAALTDTAAEAQQVRFFVRRSTGLFEITAGATGGRFGLAPTGATSQVPGVGALAVVGRTDRSSNGETVVTQVRGSGLAQVSVTYAAANGLPRTLLAAAVPLPFVVPQSLSPRSAFDGFTVAVTQGGKTVSRRFPIGSRH